jgi:hypothetical protein
MTEPLQLVCRYPMVWELKGLRVCHHFRQSKCLHTVNVLIGEWCEWRSSRSIVHVHWDIGDDRSNNRSSTFAHLSLIINVNVTIYIQIYVLRLVVAKCW